MTDKQDSNRALRSDRATRASTEPASSLGHSAGIASAWQPINTAPFQTVLEVRNEQMEKPVLATRGYTHNGMVHPDDTFFTSVYTPDQFFPFPAGKLVCPTEWRLPEEQS